MTKSRFTEHIVTARKTRKLTREAAAELLNISASTLEKYERGDLRVNSAVAADMARVYADPTITAAYCGTECAIGALDGTNAECGKSADRLMLDLLAADERALPDTVRTLYRILADGVIDADEEPIRDDCLRFIDTLSDRLDALRWAVLKAGTNEDEAA